MPRKIEISHKTIIFTFITLIAIFFLYQIRDILMILFVSLLIMTILNPIVRKLSRFKIPRAISVLIVYLLFFTILIISLFTIVPPLIEQTSNFASGLPVFVADLHLAPNISSEISSQLLNTIGNVPTKLLDFGVGIVSNIFTLFFILTFAFYLLMARNKLDSQLNVLIGEKKTKSLVEFIDELELKLGGWARGQILLMISVGTANYFGLRILGIPYALPLAIFAGLFEIVPYAGPIIGAVPAIIIGFGISPILGLGATALAFLVQQVENYVLVPKIMEKSVGVSPIITLLALTIGFKVAGIVGVLISIPVVITLQVLAKKRFLV